jgi:hypothetical protein
MKSNDLGKKLLVEECQKISVNLFLKKAKSGLKETLISSQLDVQGLAIQLTTSKTGFGGIRHWFECPMCKARVGVLYAHPLNQQIGCRQCLGLEYRKRRYKGMIENQLLRTE